MLTRRMLSVGSLFIILIFFTSMAIPQEPGRLQRLKKRVAVFEFEDKTDHRVRWWAGQSVGQGMADMLTTALVKSGKYRVIERTAIEQIIKEQKLGLTGAVTPQSAAQVGKLLGVELAVMGSVTEFGHSKGGIGGRYKGIGVGIKSTSATVGVDVRFVNTETGEIILAESVRKEKSKKGLAVRTPKVAFRDRNEFDQSLVGKATREAIDEIVRLIDKGMANVPWQAKVVTARGNVVFINSGAQAGVEVGDVFTVYRKGEELIDPDTGLSLGAVETAIGTIKVVKNNIGEGKASQCVILTGSGFSKGDMVRIK